MILFEGDDSWLIDSVLIKIEHFLKPLQEQHYNFSKSIILQTTSNLLPFNLQKARNIANLNHQIATHH
jgi:hypothetical protein